MPEREGPLSKRAGDSLRADITLGAYVGRLPSMDILAKKYHVSRVTMRNAMKYLAVEGLLRIRQGSGTFVNVQGESQESVARNFTSELPGTFAEAIGRYAQFLVNSQIQREVRVRMIGIIDAQIGLVEQSQQPEIHSDRKEKGV